MAGQLKNHPLTELVREISAEKLSGALRLAHERAKSVVYFGTGEIIYAASNMRAYRLIECIRRWNVLSGEQLAGLRIDGTDPELGAALVQSGTLSREVLDALMARQVSEVLCHALMWTDGEWDFDPRVRLAEDLRVSIKTKKLLIESARRLPAELVAQSFKDRDDKLFPELGAPDDLDLSPTEAFILTRVDAPISISELLAVGGLAEDETLRAIYTLSLGGFVRRERWPQALSAEELTKGRAVKAAPAEQASKVEAAESKTETKTEPKAATPSTPTEEKGDEQEGPDALFARLSSADNYYHVMGVVRSASASDIKRAYHALAKRFHPDRFRREADAALLKRIEGAFAQIAQAYETLKDKTSRAVYDSRLLKEELAARANKETQAAKQAETNLKQGMAATQSDASTPFAGSQSKPTPYQAEEIFQRGLSALKQGNHAAAIASLGEAARIIPNEPRYRAHFGQALARDQRLRHSAEAELKAAIALDAKNASYRVMLAEFYSEIGLVRRAQGELERALSTDPQNVAARQLLDKMKGRG